MLHDHGDLLGDDRTYYLGDELLGLLRNMSKTKGHMPLGMATALLLVILALYVQSTTSIVPFSSSSLILGRSGSRASASVPGSDE